MAIFHVVPKGDAVSHNVRGTTCKCDPETQTVDTEESRSGHDEWIYHRRVTLEEAIFVGEAGPELAVPGVA